MSALLLLFLINLHLLLQELLLKKSKFCFISFRLATSSLSFDLADHVRVFLFLRILFLLVATMRGTSRSIATFSFTSRLHGIAVVSIHDINSNRKRASTIFVSYTHFRMFYTKFPAFV